jgi:ubiquinone/menaquinone biosynthesis C-methylase UbiE
MKKEQSSDYVLGNSDSELQRLIEQSLFYRELTSQFLRSSGLKDGMRVLDVGCGAGDVSFFAKELVGPTGSVLGIDKSTEAIVLAQKRAVATDVTRVNFEVGDILNLDVERKFDALIGRLILMYFPDPAKVLKTLVKHINPGGIVAFQEMDMSIVKSVPESPSYDQCCNWILSTFKSAQIQTDFGPKLYSIYLNAGLPSPKMSMGARIGGGPDAPGYEYATNVLRSLLPMSEKFGVTNAEEVKLDTLTDRIKQEVISNKGVVISPAMVGAWTRTRS